MKIFNLKYLESGVFANKISSSYGLLIQVGENEPYGVDVSSDVVVLAYNKIITEYESGRKEIRTYNRDGSYSTEVIEAVVETTNSSSVSESAASKEKVKTKTND